MCEDKEQKRSNYRALACSGFPRLIKRGTNKGRRESVIGKVRGKSGEHGVWDYLQNLF